jgi:hypothetical protein
MFVSAYLAHAPAGTFEKAFMFAGYLPTTHEGVLADINAAAPFDDIPALVWMGAQDGTISNPMTTAQAGIYKDPTIITSIAAGHVVPGPYDGTWCQVAAFIRGVSAEDCLEDGGSTAPDDGKDGEDDGKDGDWDWDGDKDGEWYDEDKEDGEDKEDDEHKEDDEDKEDGEDTEGDESLNGAAGSAAAGKLALAGTLLAAALL